jgi:hypothetical protein
MSKVMVKVTAVTGAGGRHIDGTFHPVDSLLNGNPDSGRHDFGTDWITQKPDCGRHNGRILRHQQIIKRPTPG